MRRLLVILLLVVATAALAGIALDTSTQFEINNCPAGGSSSVAVNEGDYLFRVTDADVYLCYAATCVTGGAKFCSGTIFELAIPRGGATLSCRSAGTGDVVLTRKGN